MAQMRCKRHNCCMSVFFVCGIRALSMHFVVSWFWYTIWLFNSSAWKITIFKNGKPSISMGHVYHGYVSHNQRVVSSDMRCELISPWVSTVQKGSCQLLQRRPPCRLLGGKPPALGDMDRRWNMGDWNDVHSAVRFEIDHDWSLFFKLLVCLLFPRCRKCQPENPDSGHFLSELILT